MELGEEPRISNVWAIDQAQKFVDNMARYLEPQTVKVLRRILELAESADRLAADIEELRRI